MGAVLALKPAKPQVVAATGSDRSDEPAHEPQLCLWIGPQFVDRPAHSCLAQAATPVPTPAACSSAAPPPRSTHALVAACDSSPTGQHIMHSTSECVAGTSFFMLSWYTCLRTRRQTDDRHTPRSSK